MAQKLIITIIIIREGGQRGHEDRNGSRWAGREGRNQALNQKRNDLVTWSVHVHVTPAFRKLFLLVLLVFYCNFLKKKLKSLKRKGGSQDQRGKARFIPLQCLLRCIIFTQNQLGLIIYL